MVFLNINLDVEWWCMLILLKQGTKLQRCLFYITPREPLIIWEKKAAIETVSA